jgi:hypothetical protein
VHSNGGSGCVAFIGGRGRWWFLCNTLSLMEGEMRKCAIGRGLAERPAGLCYATSRPEGGYGLVLLGRGGLLAWRMRPGRLVAWVEMA